MFSAAESVRPAALRAGDPPLYANETMELRALINKWADFYAVPR
ncbi:MAG: lytic transglycosylase domain-containing protein, partial [Maritimibacter sp.]|nr:lytic transglycosylase domain-containing protein [Maritimibacter sp.]